MSEEDKKLGLICGAIMGGLIGVVLGMNFGQRAGERNYTPAFGSVVKDVDGDGLGDIIITNMNGKEITLYRKEDGYYYSIDYLSKVERENRK